MRISDWSSDVCSSDLLRNGRNREAMVLAVRDSWLAVPGCCAAQRLNQANPRSGLSLNELSALAHWRELWMTRQLVSELYPGQIIGMPVDRKSTRLNSSH